MMRTISADFAVNERELASNSVPMNRRDALAILNDRLPILEPGHVWLVGAGPGDPGMLTLDAVAGITQADVIIHDDLIDRRVLALAGPQAQLEYAGKRGGKPSTQQAAISRRLVELARAGRRVVRLKGGDPCVFGRGGEEAQALANAGIAYRIVPGLTAGLSGLAAASIPATMRGVNQAIIFAVGHAGTDDPLDWAALARTKQPIVIYMGMRNARTIADALMHGGASPDTPAAVIVAATTAQQRIVVSSLDRLADEVEAIGLGLPGLIVVGDIVAVREDLLQIAAEFESAR
jgi:uroporphyrin-III C-methyltransferase